MPGTHLAAARPRSATGYTAPCLPFSLHSWSAVAFTMYRADGIAVLLLTGHSVPFLYYSCSISPLSCEAVRMERAAAEPIRKKERPGWWSIKKVCAGWVL